MVALSGAGWRLAPCLVAMVEEADKIAPNRNRKADGSIGDAAHRNRTSDHNPASGWVTAVDLTHAPESGFDAHARARLVVGRQDPRIKYVISNGQIARSYDKPGIRAWTWAPYAGTNPHRFHAHFSVNNTATARNDCTPWWPHSPATKPTIITEDLDDMPELKIIEAFHDWLGRPPEDKELAAHTYYAAEHGIVAAVLNIARSDEAKARR